MRHFQKIAEGVDTLPVLLALQRQPRLWNADRRRQEFEHSPHADVDDILLRFEDDVSDAATLRWRDGWVDLPEVRPLLPALLMRLQAYSLMRVMITRLAPGREIKPHKDVLGDYVSVPDLVRAHVVLQGLPGCQFYCGGETVQMLTGEVWTFDAREAHAVVNNSADDRIHLIVDARVM